MHVSMIAPTVGNAKQSGVTYHQDGEDQEDPGDKSVRAFDFPSRGSKSCSLQGFHRRAFSMMLWT